MRALVVVMLLAGCGGPPKPSFEAALPQSPITAECERGVYDDPVVKDLLLKSAGSEVFEHEHIEDMKRAKQDATLSCLRRRGLVRSGGVERPRPQ